MAGFRPFSILYRLSFIVLLYLLSGCNNSNPLRGQSIVNDSLHQFSSFPTRENAAFSLFFEYEQPYARNLFLTDSSIILTNNAAFMGGYFFYEFSLRNHDLIGKYVKGGRKSGQALSPLSCGLLDKHLLWFSDISLEKMYVGDLRNKYTDTTIAYKEYSTPYFSYSVQLLDSDRILRSGIYDIPEMFEIRNMEADQQLSAFGKLHQGPSDIPFDSWKRAHEGFLFLKPSGEKAALAYRYTDKVTIIDLDSGKSITIDGPHHYNPEFIPILAGKKYLIQRTEKTVFAFNNGAVTNQYIYLLYSGKHENEKHPFEGKSIFIYDWDGNPIKEIGLGRYVSGFTVSENDSTLYVFDIEEKSVFSAILKLSK